MEYPNKKQKIWNIQIKNRKYGKSYIYILNMEYPNKNYKILGYRIGG